MSQLLGNTLVEERTVKELYIDGHKVKEIYNNGNIQAYMCEDRERIFICQGYAPIMLILADGGDYTTHICMEWAKGDVKNREES